MSAVIFGWGFDQVTVRNSPEYFTLGHPIRPDWLPDPATHPTQVALFWGFAATWWVGVGLGLVHGLVLVLFNPQASARDLLRRHGVFVGVLWLLSLLVFLAAPAFVDGRAFSESLATQLTPDQLDRFAQNALTHSFGYLGAGVGALLLYAYALWRGLRDRRA